MQVLALQTASQECKHPSSSRGLHLLTHVTCCCVAAPAAAPKPLLSKPRAGAGAKPRLLASKKPAAKTGGLGVKKMATKADDSIFEQAPAEAPIVVLAQASASPWRCIASSLSASPS